MLVQIKVRLSNEAGSPLMFNKMTDAAMEQLEKGIRGKKQLREIFDIAGRRIGVGSFRPARKGPFGKFKVDLWQVGADGKVLEQAGTVHPK